MVSVKGIRRAVLPVAVLLLIASSVQVFSAGLSSAEPLAGRNETPEIEWATASTDIPSFAEMASSGRTIRVESPGEGNDIRGPLEAALKRAQAGDTVLLPAGSFAIIGTLECDLTKKPNLHLKGAGRGAGGTRLHRIKGEAHPMLVFSGNGDGEDMLEVSQIWFQGLKGRFTPSGEGSAAEERGISFRSVNFYLHHCKLQWFARAAVSVSHPVERGMGIVANNEFVDNLTVRAERHGESWWAPSYGVVVSAPAEKWPVVHPGTDTFLFIEDNYFSGHRHAVAGGHNGLYVFRYNHVERSANTHPIDMHGARPPHVDRNYRYSTRFTEIYGNTVVGTPKESPLCGRYGNLFAVSVRGGEAVVWGNTFRNLETPVKIRVEPAFYRFETKEHPVPTYPVPYQAGYISAVEYGPDHTGTDVDTFGRGDVFVWENTLVNVKEEIIVMPSAGYFKEGRDYHRVPRPGYRPYPYPHPRRRPEEVADRVLKKTGKE